MTITTEQAEQIIEIPGTGAAATAALSPTDSTAILLAELARLKAENETLRRTPQGRPVTFKVSEKGAISVYGLGQFPVTLYEEQWGRLLGATEDLKGFIAKAKTNGLLATPEQKAERKAAAKEAAKIAEAAKKVANGILGA